MQLNLIVSQFAPRNHFDGLYKVQFNQEYIEEAVTKSPSKKGLLTIFYHLILTTPVRCLEIKAILSSFDWILKHVAASSPQTLVRQIPRTLSASRKVVLRVGRAPTGPIDTEWIRRWLLTTIDTTTQWIIWHVNNTEKSDIAARSMKYHLLFGYRPASQFQHIWLFARKNGDPWDNTEHLLA